MKTRFIKVTFVVAIAMIGAINVFNTNRTETLSDIALANVEALADGEIRWCSNNCKEWRGTTGGGIACDCGRYTGRCKNYC